jgi:hypothetical protein
MNVKEWNRKERYRKKIIRKKRKREKIIKRKYYNLKRC